MELFSCQHSFVNRILAKLRTGERSTMGVADVERYLRTIDGISGVEGDLRSGELLILFDKEKIDANSVLHLLGYSGSFAEPQSLAR
jgi:hypothetical protein